MEKTTIFKIRRVFGFIIVICLAAQTHFANAQTTRLTIKMNNVALERVLTEIENQSRYLVVNRDVKDLNQQVSINVENKSVNETLSELFKGKSINFEVDGTTIILTEKKQSQETTKTIKGLVRDTKGQPVMSATVFVAGTSFGTTTDARGEFILRIPSSAANLQVSFLGYENAILAIGNRTYFEITLKESTISVDQVVVTALGIKREQKALSYNVQLVDSESITSIKDANFINSLAGKVAGVQINSSSSGVGGASKVIMRGQKSISQSSNALYVIDGIPMFNFGGEGGKEFDSRGSSEGIADINPEDIESISVLTGAAAAALYGSNAANGAIMITTKKGETGDLKVSLSNNTDFLSPFILPEFQNRYGTGSKGLSGNSSIYSWGKKLAPAAQFGYTPEDFLQRGYSTTTALSLSGGTDKNQTYLSAATVNSEGIIPNNEYDRYNFTFRNTSYFLNDRLQLDASASYIYQKDQNMINQGVYSNPLVSAYMFPRGEDFSIYNIFERYDPAKKMMTQFWSDDLSGGDLRMQNPYWAAYRNLANNDKKRYMLSLSSSFKLNDWMSIVGRVRMDNANSLYTRKLYASSNTTLTDGGTQGHYTEARGYDTQTYADIMLNINKRVDNFNIHANIGSSINNTKTDLLKYEGPIREDGLPNVFNVFDLDNIKKRASKEGWREQTQSLFASVELGWKSMLYLTLTGRNDWASQLANSPESSFFYPSAGLSWIPTSQWNLGETLTYLKLRGSVASVGIPFPRHLTIPTYEYNAGNQSWEPKTHYPIGDLYPERTRTYELGFDGRLWHNINFSLSWYYADTFNQTFDPKISVSSGYNKIYLQTGHVRNTGVEAQLGYDNSWRDFSWSSNFTFSWNKNKIIELVKNYVHPETGQFITKDRLEVGKMGKAKYILKSGGTLGDLYTTSNLKYNEQGYIEIDRNGNPIVIDNNPDILLGSVFPKFNMAWNNQFSWKGIHMSVLFSGRVGGVCYSATQANMDLFGVSEASALARDAGGVVVNGRSMIDPQSWYQTIGSQSGLPQYYTYSATNFRLKELSFGYRLPSKWFDNVCNIDVSLVGRNLWMIYCKAPFDPEAVASTGINYQGIDYFMMPSLRNIGFSVKLTF